MIRVRAAWPLLLGAAAVSAQQSPAPVDPVVANFRAYRAALERDDLPAAETAAAAALAASEAAQGRRTAVLALNLANLRLELGGEHDALPPAATAHRLATSADSGVDPVAATLTLGRAELAARNPAGAARLRDALEAAAGNSALEADAFNGAVALGQWSLEAKDYGAARTAWSTAARLAHATGDPRFERGRALIGEGAAIMLAAIDRSGARPDGAAPTLSAADAQAASDAFSIAQGLLAGGAFPEAAGAELTAGQRAFAEALAWQAALLSKLRSSGVPPPAPPAEQPPSDPTNRCTMRTVRGEQPIEYPPEALDRYGLGAVVVHLGLAPTGETTSRTIAAAIPPGVLAAAVAKVYGAWYAEVDPRSPAGCRIPSSVYSSVRFVLD
jgi:hypothetical protein